MSASSRPFAILGAQLAYGDAGVTALKAGRCPSCKQEIGEFRDSLSRREFQISGLCQSCQDSVFGSAEEEEEYA